MYELSVLDAAELQAMLLAAPQAPLRSYRFWGIPALEGQMPEQSTRMSHSAHEPAVRRKSLLVL
jgi:hypothetical protein